MMVRLNNSLFATTADFINDIIKTSVSLAFFSPPSYVVMKDTWTDGEEDTAHLE